MSTDSLRGSSVPSLGHHAVHAHGGRDRLFYADGEFESHYKVCKTLGRGNFGETKLVEDKSDRSLWAAKVQRVAAMDEEDRKNFVLECSILRSLPRHRSICWTREIFRSATHTHIVVELLTGGELFDRVVQKEFYSEAEAISTVRQIAEALSVVHAAGVVHRDLKPENILYASMAVTAPVKLVDFGMSAYVLTSCGRRVDDLLDTKNNVELVRAAHTSSVAACHVSYRELTTIVVALPCHRVTHRVRADTMWRASTNPSRSRAEPPPTLLRRCSRVVGTTKQRTSGASV